MDREQVSVMTQKMILGHYKDLPKNNLNSVQQPVKINEYSIILHYFPKKSHEDKIREKN
jgi:hypothetical protein